MVQEKAQQKFIPAEEAITAETVKEKSTAERYISPEIAGKILTHAWVRMEQDRHKQVVDQALEQIVTKEVKEDPGFKLSVDDIVSIGRDMELEPAQVRDAIQLYCPPHEQQLADIQKFGVKPSLKILENKHFDLRKEYISELLRLFSCYNPSHQYKARELIFDWDGHHWLNFIGRPYSFSYNIIQQESKQIRKRRLLFPWQTKTFTETTNLLIVYIHFKYSDTFSPSLELYSPLFLQACGEAHDKLITNLRKRHPEVFDEKCPVTMRQHYLV